MLPRPRRMGFWERTGITRMATRVEKAAVFGKLKVLSPCEPHRSGCEFPLSNRRGERMIAPEIRVPAIGVGYD